jgi:hypothetical protein
MLISIHETLIKETKYIKSILNLYNLFLKNVKIVFFNNNKKTLIKINELVQS